MRDETFEDQIELIELIEDAGYDVASVDMREHEIDRGDNEVLYVVAIDILASAEYMEGGGFENPYRVKEHYKLVKRASNRSMGPTRRIQL